MTNVRLVVPIVCVLAAGCASQAPEESAQPAQQPHANLLQLMRTIPFPNANIVYDTQLVDPEAPVEPSETGDSQAATQLFAGIYTGWPQVESAALAIAETANLLLIPGRVCGNGAPVPIENEDFRMWTQQLADAGVAAYQAAQTKDMDEMILVSGTLTEACDNCHQRYRETPKQPEDRCM